MPINGTENSDVIVGTDGDDVIYGLGGHDQIDGGDGADTIYGGPGYDTFVGTVDGDNDTYDGGDDYDGVNYASANAAVLIDFRLASGQARSLEAGDAAGIGIDTLVSIETVVGSRYGDRMIAATDRFASFYGGLGNDTLIGSNVHDEMHGEEGNDHIEGGDGDDYITGGDGDDEIFGGNGNDEMFTGSGSDLINGGAGNDSAELVPGGRDVFIGGSGSDTVIFGTGGSVTVSLLNPGVDQTVDAGWTVNLTSVENILGGFGDDTLIGDSGANTLDGRGGADIMNGGAGNDSYYVDNAGDVIVEGAGGGIDTVYTFGLQESGPPSYTLPEFIENGSSIGESVLWLYGNDGANTLRVSGGNMFGEGGNDRLYGGYWSNLLDGGTGIDIMWGGAGDDTYYVDDVHDRPVEYAGEGHDTVYASVDYFLRPEVEALFLTGDALIAKGNATDNGLVGTDGDNRLYGFGGHDNLNGGAGNDWLDGGTGADTMSGGLGNDVYVVDNVGDQVFESGGQGVDTVYSSVTFSAEYGEIENIYLNGSADINCTGNVFDNVIKGNNRINVIDGHMGNDKLFGLGGDDTIYGGDGNDWIQGGAGTDQLYGGTGADQFVFDDGEFGGRARGNGDVIHDFNRSDGDRIRLSLADADISTPEDDAFTFIGSAAFSGHAGELRAVAYQGDMIVTGDVDGDGVADFLIIVSNTASLQASDFIF